MSEKDVTVIAAVPGDNWVGQTRNPDGALMAESAVVVWLVCSDGSVRAVWASEFNIDDPDGSFRVVKAADTKPPARTKRKPAASTEQ